jgi:uncharacterized protein
MEASMPHPRPRFCLAEFKRKLNFQRVVLVQGVRQCGKSFFLRELFCQNQPDITYVTLDQPSEKNFALNNPETFLNRLGEFRTVIIDEAQKAPALFDTVKYMVDLNPKPGQYVLVGSTEFSLKNNIRESLTGRATTLRLYPLTLAEALKQNHTDIRIFPQKITNTSANRSQFIRHLTQGGMPGIFSVHTKSEHRDLILDWLSLTTQRDIQQLPGGKKDSQLAMSILHQIALLEEPTAAEIAKSLHVNARKINSHIDALKSLFAITELPPSNLGTGKSRFFHCDVSFATYFGATFKRQIETLYLQEMLSFRANSDQDAINSLSYYRTTKGSVVDFLFTNQENRTICIKIHDKETVNQGDLRNILNLQKKINGPVELICAAGVAREQNLTGVRIVPWESVSSIQTQASTNKITLNPS